MLDPKTRARPPKLTVEENRAGDDRGRNAQPQERCHCLRDVMLDHATVRTHDLEGTRAFLVAVLGRKLGSD
jgi:hypothetical protein